MSASAQPLRGGVIGVLYLDVANAHMLADATRATLEAFATQAALAIESAAVRRSAEKARTDRDLRIAAEIQRACCRMPTTRVVLRRGSRVGALPDGWRDFFDYLQLAESYFGFTLGDVAARAPRRHFLAAVVQSNFAAQAPLGTDPAQTMTASTRRC